MNINWEFVFSSWAKIIESSLVIWAVLIVIALPIMLFFGVVYVIGRRFDK